MTTLGMEPLFDLDDKDNEAFAGLLGASGFGGVIKRIDEVSASTKEKGDLFEKVVQAFVRQEAHYGVESTRTNPRSSHENGVVEQGHRRLKNALNQALILRGSRDFGSENEYRQFVRRVVDRRNRLVDSKLKTERRHLRPLPPPEPFSLEMAGDVDGVTLMTRCLDDQEVRGQIADHYPQARIRELSPEDDSLRLDEGEEAWGMTLRSSGPDVQHIANLRQLTIRTLSMVAVCP